MITSTDAVTTHELLTTHGAGQVLVTRDSNVAFVHGDDRLVEATLVIRARCVVNADALRVDTCDCADRSTVALDVVRRAPLGVFVYLNDASVESFADVLVILAAFPNVSQIYLPFASVGDVALLRETSDYRLLHLPNVTPPGDVTWPRPRANRPRWRARLDEMRKTLRW